MIRAYIRNMKIRKKLILSYLLACVIPLVMACLVIYRVSADNLEETTLELASAFSSQIVAGMDDFIDEYDRVTKTVLVDNDTIYKLDDGGGASVTEQLNRQLNLRKIMLRLVTMKPEIKNICFLTAEDQFYQFNLEGSYADQEALKRQEWLAAMLSSEETLAVSAVHDRAYNDRYQDGIVITIGRKIFDNRGSYAGLLLMDIDPNSLIKLSDGFLLTRNQYNIKISITDADNGILYDSDVASGRITWEEAQSGDGALLDQKYLQDYIVLSNETARAGLRVNIVIPKSSLLFKINRIGYVTAAAVLGCILVIMLTSAFFARMITRPIDGLQKRMQQVEDGEYKELIRMESGDEIGRLISSYNRMVMRIKALIEDVYMAEIKQKNARYLALKTQINPHMLYNTLESIRMKALILGADEVADMVKILARMFRMTLHENPAPHRLQDEIDYAEHYMQLQNMRFDNNFMLSVEMEARIREARIIAMVLQPLIENCIEHGARGHQKLLHIFVTGELSAADDIMIRVRDDGKGMTPEQIGSLNYLLGRAEADKYKLDNKEEQQGGIGLKNIAERIKLYYGERYYLRVAGNADRGTVIEVLIPGRWLPAEGEKGEAE